MNAVVSTIKDRARCPHHTVSFGKCQSCGHDFVIDAPAGPTMAMEAIERDDLADMGYDNKLQDQEVKATAEPDWRTALVVRLGIGTYFGRQGDVEEDYPWLCLNSGSFTSESCLRRNGPPTVIIDADGNNVEAEAHANAFKIVQAEQTKLRKAAERERDGAILDRNRAEMARDIAAENAERIDHRLSQVGDMATRAHLAWKSARKRAKRARQKLINEGDEWEAIYNEQCDKTKTAESARDEAIRARETALRDLRKAEQNADRLAEMASEIAAQRDAAEKKLAHFQRIAASRESEVREQCSLEGNDMCICPSKADQS